MTTLNRWHSLGRKQVADKVVHLRMREGVKRSADHAPHVEIEARCGTVTITRAHTVAANHQRLPEHLERDLQTFAQQVAEECAGHHQSDNLLKEHIKKHRRAAKAE